MEFSDPENSPVFLKKIYYCKKKQHKSWKVEPDVYKGPESSCRFLEDLSLCQQRAPVFSQVRCSLEEFGNRAPYTNSVPSTGHVKVRENILCASSVSCEMLWRSELLPSIWTSSLSLWWASSRCCGDDCPTGVLC